MGVLEGAKERKAATREAVLKVILAIATIR